MRLAIFAAVGTPSGVLGEQHDLGQIAADQRVDREQLGKQRGFCGVGQLVAFFLQYIRVAKPYAQTMR